MYSVSVFRHLILSFFHSLHLQFHCHHLPCFFSGIILQPKMTRKRPRSQSPETCSPRLRRKAKELINNPAVPREDLVFSAKTDISEDSHALALVAAGNRIDAYKPSPDRNHDGILQNSLKAFLKFLPDGGRDEIIKDINKAYSNQQLYEFFDDLYTGLRSRGEFDFYYKLQKQQLINCT